MICFVLFCRRSNTMVYKIVFTIDLDFIYSIKQLTYSGMDNPLALFGFIELIVCC
jgi:hypothetical protein